MNKQNNPETPKKSAGDNSDIFNQPYRLVRSNTLKKYYRFCGWLYNFKFLRGKIQDPKFGIQAMIEDYDLLDTPEAKKHSDRNPETVRALRLIQQALQLKVDSIAKEPKELASYLWDKLRCFSELPEINHLLQKAKKSKKENKEVWLKPLNSSSSLSGRRLLRILLGHGNRINVVATNGNCNQVVAGLEDGTLQVWDLEALKTGEPAFTTISRDKHDKSVTTIAITPDNKQVVAGLKDGTLEVWKFHKQWDSDKKKEIFTLQAPFTLTEEKEQYAITTLAITSTSKGKWVTIVGQRNQTWQYLLECSLVRLGGLVNLWGFFGWLVWGILGAGFLGSWNWLGLGFWGLLGWGGLFQSLDLWGLWGKSHWVIKWDLAKKEKVFSKGFDADTITLTPDGTKAILWSIKIAGGGSSYHYRPGKYVDIKIKNLPPTQTSTKGDQVYIDNAEGEPTFTVVAIAPNEKQVIFRVGDKNLVVYNLETKDQFTLEGHNEEVTAVAITPDGKYAISSSKDETLKIWSLETMQELLTLTDHFGWVNLVAIAPDGKKAISSSKDGTMRIWSLENLDLSL